MFITPRLIAIALCAALNFAIGSIVYLIKLPIYMDSVGMILCALLLAPDYKAGFVCSVISGAISTVIITLLVNPFLIWFMGTVVVIAIISAFFTARFADIFRARPLAPAKFAATILLCGVLTGIAAAIVSAPVVVHLFGGVTGSGSAFIVAFFLKTGQQLMNAAILSGLTSDPIDKVIQVLLAVSLYRATPGEFIAMLKPQ